ncbi:MAG TPA: hypothetical protein VMI94_08290 [Bryobacteraceae bacterium]|nr:hypothetical protein [Bryobacteraceae bacterium]
MAKPRAYKADTNNGQMYQRVDSVNGETITYQYDSLKRLIRAYTTSASWSENYTYDGFGNLTQTSGNAPSVPALTLSVNLANQVTSIPGVSYDGNGNVTQVGASPGTTMGYDVANRLANVTTSGGTGAYAYDPSNQRTYYRQTTSGGTTETLYIYGLDGNRLAAYGLALSGGNISLTLTNINVYFAGKLISAEGNAVAVDGLGSIRWSAGSRGTTQTPYGPGDFTCVPIAGWTPPSSNPAPAAHNNLKRVVPEVPIPASDPGHPWHRE